MNYKTSICIVILIIGAVSAGMWLQKDKQENYAKKTDCVNFNEAVGEVPETYKVYLRSRNFIPREGIECSLLDKLESSGNTHAVLQFRSNPSEQQKNELQNSGVSLVYYIHEMSYAASVPSSESRLREIKNLSYVRWIGDFLPEDKMSPYVRESNSGAWATNPDGSVNMIVEFFDDIPLDKGEKLIERYRGIVNDRVVSINALVITIPRESILKIASEDSVQLIDFVSPPPTIDRQSD